MHCDLGRLTRASKHFEIRHAYIGPQEVLRSSGGWCAWSIRGQMSVRASDELLVNRAVGHRQSFMAGQPPPKFVAKACESLSAEGVMPSD